MATRPHPEKRIFGLAGLSQGRRLLTIKGCRYDRMIWERTLLLFLPAVSNRDSE
jgi:hypothetical protein